MKKSVSRVISLILCIAMIITFDCTGITTALAAGTDVAEKTAVFEGDTTADTDVKDTSSEEPQYSPVSLESLIDEEGYLTDEGLLSLKYLPYDEDKYILILLITVMGHKR